MEHKERNPFYFGGTVSNEDFCNRERELEELKRDIFSGINILLYSPRRFGKSSLLLRLKEQLENEGIKVILLDLFPVVDEKDFINRYFDETIKTLLSRKEKVIQTLKELTNLNFSVSSTLKPDGSVTFSVSFSSKEKKTVLKEILEIPFLYATKNNANVAVIFDEFQEVENLGLEKEIRTVIQNHGRNVSYVFSGSKKSVLTQIFSNKSRPFYKSVKKFPLKEIPLEEWIPFIQNKFEKTGKKIDEEIIKEVFCICRGFPYYIQHICYVLWEVSKEKVKKEDLDYAINLVLEREEDSFWEEWSNLPPTQKKALKIITYTNGKNIYSKNTLSEFEITASHLKRAIEQLQKKDIITKERNTYQIIDPIMELWIKKNF
ncbi:MAG TPA: ATP-binding protein [Persephonella sp.]|uniref:Putative archaeal ATPase n=1 Tax=Persephonella marina (strain DSM 14350 / EX-H1) TaxID=123214 RepID=C0QPH6_PERMH|nr:MULTISPECIES: ATP-binding protein [Persephonella]ACO03139.1 putative archaeal ATPase [Persephonella marina EX-H1]HCB69814.1 ATP-binding protein [Persephonella sp.]